MHTSRIVFAFLLLASCASNDARIPPSDDLITVSVVNYFEEKNAFELDVGIEGGAGADRKLTVGAKLGTDIKSGNFGAYKQTKMPRHLIDKVFDNPSAWIVVINPDGTLRIESRPPGPVTPPVPPLSEMVEAAKTIVLKLQGSSLANPKNEVPNKAVTLQQLLQCCRLYLNISKDAQDTRNPKFTAADREHIGKKREQARNAMLGNIEGSNVEASSGWPRVSIDELRAWQDGLFDVLAALKKLTDHPDCKRGLADRLAAPSSRLESEALVWSTFLDVLGTRTAIVDIDKKLALLQKADNADAVRSLAVVAAELESAR